jgi:hypothetical protein
MASQKKTAFAYLHTSSANNAGPDKDSDKRQRAAIAAFAKGHGYIIEDWIYDAAVSGAGPIMSGLGSKPCSIALLPMESRSLCPRSHRPRFPARR